MQAAEIMNRRPITVDAEATIAEAARLMLRHRISGLPVTGPDGTVVGMLTEGDLLRRAETGTARRRPHWLELLIGPGRLADDYVAAHARRVNEAMTAGVVSIGPREPLEAVVRLMERHRVKRLPVIDEKRRLVGIVSRADLVRALANKLAQAAATEAEVPASDGEIRERIAAIVAKEPWGPRFSINIAVADGVVDLYGTVTDERERTAARVAAETVPGVKAVRDHLVWIEPTSGIAIPPPAFRTGQS